MSLALPTRFATAAVERYVSDVAAMCGESPEAWRGAFAASALFCMRMGAFAPADAVTEALVREHVGGEVMDDDDRMDALAMFVDAAPGMLAGYAADLVGEDVEDEARQVFRDSAIAALREVGIDVRIVEP